jgi:hypothetical protein
MRIPRLLILLALILVSACGTGTAQPTQTLAPTAAASSTPTESPTVPAPPTQTSVPTSAVATVTTIDDFEASDTAWKAGTVPDYTDSSALSVALTSEHASQGKQALQLNFEQNDKPKAIFFLDQQLDLSQASILQFDIYNPGTVSGVGIAMTTGVDSVWYESDSLSVEKGKQTSLSFDLTAGTYKAASTNWEFRANIADLNSVSRLAIIIYPAQSGAVFVDNLRLGNTP